MKIEIPARDAVREIKLDVRVTGLPVWRVRVWLGATLIKFGALVIGCSVEIEAADSGLRTDPRLAADGLPEAAALRPGLGVPVIEIADMPSVRVTCDGKIVDRCIGYDRSAGVAWFYDYDGPRVGGDIAIARRTGVITLEPLA